MTTQGKVMGWVEMQVFGLQTGRFVSLCLSHGISLHDIHDIEGDGISCRICNKDFFKLKQIRKKTKVHVCITKKCGLLPYLRTHIWMRVTFLAIIAIAILLAEYDARIWRYEFLGNSYLTDECLEACLFDLGYYRGIASSGIDSQVLKQQLQQMYPEIAWCSICCKDRCLHIEIKEALIARENSLPEAQADATYHLVSDVEGTVTHIVTRNGTPLVKAQDEIHSGDVLIAGAEEIRNDADEIVGYLYMPADGDIYARVVYEFSMEIPKISKHRYSTGRRTRELILGNTKRMIEVPMINPTFSYENVIRQYYPIRLDKNHTLWCEYIQRGEQYVRLEKVDLEEAKVLAKNSFTNYVNALEEEKTLSIINQNYNVIQEQNCYQVRGTVTVDQKVGCYKKEGIQDYEYERGID